MFLTSKLYLFTTLDVSFTPSKQLQVQVHVVPMEKRGGAVAEGGGSGDPNDGEEPPRKRAKVMLLQVMRKGMYSICGSHS